MLTLSYVECKFCNTSKYLSTPGRSIFKPFHATGLFRYLLKTSENHWFSDVFKGYRKRPVVWNGLKSCQISMMALFINYFHQKTLSQIFERVLIHLCISFQKNCSRTSPKSKFKLKNNKRLNNKNSEVKAIRVNVNLGQAEKIASEFLLKTLNYFNQSCISYRNQVFWFVAQVKWLVCYEMQH